MKYFLFIIVCLLSTITAHADPCLVHYNDDGSVSVEYFNWKLYPGTNSKAAKDAWMRTNSRQYIAAKSDAIDTNALPTDRAKRYQWRATKGQPVIVDPSVTKQ